MTEKEQTRIINLARRILKYNIEAKYYSNNGILNMDENKIKKLKVEHEKINATIKMLYPNSKPENFLFDIKNNIEYVNDMDIIIDELSVQE